MNKHSLATEKHGKSIFVWHNQYKCHKVWLGRLNLTYKMWLLFFFLNPEKAADFTFVTGL